jgi:hypothetical protein
VSRLRARLRDYRFKQMEYTLPEEYKDENELERQRKIHDSLIAMGLQLISDSYLDVMAKRAEEAGLPFERKMMDGKHYKALIEDCQASDYDLVVMGALGMGAVKDSHLGSVTERFVRRCRSTPGRRVSSRRAQQGAIVVGLDGPPVVPRLKSASPRGLGRPLHAVAVCDFPPLRDVQRHRRCCPEGVIPGSRSRQSTEIITPGPPDLPVALEIGRLAREEGTWRSPSGRKCFGKCSSSAGRNGPGS